MARAASSGAAAVVACLSAATMLAGCAAHNLPVTTVTLGKARLLVEVADTPAARQTGMQIHSAAPADRGMLFVYPDAAARTFDIKTLRYVLDVVFVSASGRVVGVRKLDPSGPREASVEEPAKWVVEAPAGWVTAHGVRVGDRLSVGTTGRR